MARKKAYIVKQTQNLLKRWENRVVAPDLEIKLEEPPEPTTSSCSHTNATVVREDVQLFSKTLSSGLNEWISNPAAPARSWKYKRVGTVPDRTRRHHRAKQKALDASIKRAGFQDIRKWVRHDGDASLQPLEPLAPSQFEGDDVVLLETVDPTPCLNSKPSSAGMPTSDPYGTLPLHLWLWQKQEEEEEEDDTNGTATNSLASCTTEFQANVNVVHGWTFKNYGVPNDGNLMDTGRAPWRILEDLNTIVGGVRS